VNDAARCQARGCKAAGNFIKGGWCPAHTPGRAARRSATGKAGARARWPKLALPVLDSPAAALTWADVIGRAAAERRIAPSTASVALRAARVALASWSLAELEPRIQQIEDRLAEERR
jgi:hypothetical protein